MSSSGCRYGSEVLYWQQKVAEFVRHYLGRDNEIVSLALPVPNISAKVVPSSPPNVNSETARVSMQKTRSLWMHSGWIPWGFSSCYV